MRFIVLVGRGFVEHPIALARVAVGTIPAPIRDDPRLQNVSTTGVDFRGFVRTREHCEHGDKEKDSKTLGRKDLRCRVVRNCAQASSNLFSRSDRLVND